MTDTNAPERISMRVASWSTNEPQPDGWCLNLADQAVTCKVGGLVFSYGIEEGLRQYTSAIRADLATPAPQDGYSAGVRAAAEVAQRHAETGRQKLRASTTREEADAWSVVISRSDMIGDAILALLDAPALPDARAGAVGEMRERCAAVLTNEAEASLKLMHSIRQSTITIEVFGEWLGRYAAAIRALPIPAAVPTPACTATDGPASACVYRAPGLGTAADYERG